MIQMQHTKNLDKQREESRRTLEEHRIREERFRSDEKKKLRKKRKVIAIIVITFLALFSLIVYPLVSEGKYNDFAKCLTDKGAVMYGEDWCKYTNAQKAMFGKSFKYINYQVKPGLKVRPTWVIDGKEYLTVQSFQTLSRLTGCKF